MKIRSVETCLMLTLLLLVPAPSSAQNGIQGVCAPGYVQYEVTGGGYNCAPAPGKLFPPDPGPKWQTRWGAIATGGGLFGFAEDMPSKRKAEKEALADCKRKSGQKCSLTTSFYNQCGSLAWGDQGNATGTAGDIATSRNVAMKTCSQGTVNCKVFYSSCSYPKRIK